MNPFGKQGSDKPAAEYEFDTKQNQVIGGLALEMHWVAAPLILLSILYGVGTVLILFQAIREPAAFIVPVTYVGLVTVFIWLLASWTQKAAASFHKVVSSGGQDISHLMEALENLRKKYALLGAFVKIYVAVILIAVIAGAISAVVSTYYPS
jgi:hypothetical protein